MSAKDKDLEISDELAKGMIFALCPYSSRLTWIVCSPEIPARTKGQDFFSVEKELRFGKGCPLS
jgi:hypothetical protein